MTTEEYFKNIASKLELVQGERDRISKKHSELREKLREKLPVEDDFLTGSYNRNTIIRPKDSEEKFDVDFFLAFSEDDYGGKELPDLLKTTKDALDEIKEDDKDILEIREQKRSIGVIYNDNFQIDVVPAIQIEKDKKYKIFDKSTQRAIVSNPKLHGSNLTFANEATESGSVKRLVPIVKLLKLWKREKCEYVKSFHLEILAVEILGGEAISSYSQGVAKFFANAGQNLQSTRLKDPANKDNIIDEYLDDDGTRTKLLDLIGEENKIVENAVNLEDEGKNDEAVKEWRKIFGKSDENKDNSHSSQSSGPTVIRNPSKPWAQ